MQLRRHEVDRPGRRHADYSWDLNGDGTFGDSTAATPSFTYTTPGVVHGAPARDRPGRSNGHDQLTITAGNPPTPTIDTPAATLTWAVGDPIAFSGRPSTAQGNPMPARA